MTTRAYMGLIAWVAAYLVLCRWCGYHVIVMQRSDGSWWHEFHCLMAALSTVALVVLLEAMALSLIERARIEPSSDVDDPGCAFCVCLACLVLVLTMASIGLGVAWLQ